MAKISNYYTDKEIEIFVNDIEALWWEESGQQTNEKEWIEI